MTTVQAIYENGTLRLLEPLPLKEGEKVTVTVTHQNSHVNLALLSAEERRHFDALKDIVIFPDPSYNEHEWVEALADELDAALQKGDKSLSQIIIEEREQGW